MRPTAASASKTHEKPASPPRKSTKAPVGAIQKGKKKIEEVAAKAKDAVTSNSHEGEDDAAAVGTTANSESPEAHKSDSVDVGPGASQEQSEANASHEAESTIVEPQAAQLADETAH
jgi:hypothetical protein